MKLSLCMIAKPSDAEAELLNRALGTVAKHVDEICITQAGKEPNKKVSEVIKKYKGKESFFKWVNDFSKARTFNFSQAKGDYIFWMDCDDVLKNAEKLKPTAEAMLKEGADCGVMQYLYDFDKYGDCIVKHLKTRIVRNDGCVKWVGALHEDFTNTRAIDSRFVPEIEVMQIVTEKKGEESAERNMEIAKAQFDKVPEDPRSLWLMANANMGMNNTLVASNYFKSFIQKSQSVDEKYIAYLNLSQIDEDIDCALNYIHKAWLLRPNYPDAYFRAGTLLYKKGQKESSRDCLELALQLPKPDMKIIVHNPRDYDYNPLVLLMNIYYDFGMVQKALKILGTLTKWTPNNPELKRKKAFLDAEMKDVLSVDKFIAEADKIKDDKAFELYIESLPEKVRSHPKICICKNKRIVKTKSSGKDLVYYCGYTTQMWNPEVAAKKGVGGSEEAVINLAKRWAKSGWNVTVYNNCGVAKKYDGVEYKPFWGYNIRDKQDVTILWRHPKPVDYGLNTGKIFIDLHDVIEAGEFNKDRLSKIDGVFVKTKAHRGLFKNIPDEKINIVPNGFDADQFVDAPEYKKTPYLICNTSSPDRHLEATLDVFEKLIKEQPDKPWKLAWYYGWGVYDIVHKDDDEMKDWKKAQMKRFNKLVKEGRAEGGTFISHDKIADLYKRSEYFLYPTQFFEIHCISAVKAQAAGCKLLTTDFAALNETAKFAVKLETKAPKWGTARTFGDSENVDSYVENLVCMGNLKDLMVDPNEWDKKRHKEKTMHFEWAKDTYDWDLIANNWKL